MKNGSIALMISLLVLVFSACADNTTTNKSDKVAHDVEPEGLQLIKKNCYACHNPNTNSHDDIIAPPLIAVKNHYSRAYSSKDEFVREMTNWIVHPEEEMALMMGAVNRFNVMPSLGISKEDAKKMATYIFENELEKPKWFAAHEKEMHGGKNGQGMGGNMWKKKIALVDGKKWHSDKATFEHIQALKRIGSNAKSLEQAGDFHQLAVQFSKELDNLLNDCTMEGPDHNALHKYLMPLMKKNKMLGQVKSVQRGAHILQKIQSQLEEYQNFFQE